MLTLRDGQSDSRAHEEHHRECTHFVEFEALTLQRLDREMIIQEVQSNDFLDSGKRI